MKHKQYLLFSLIFLLTSFCDEKKEKIFSFDPRNICEGKFSLSKIADDIIYIPLDNSYPVSLIYNCYFINNYIFLNTKDIGVLKFNREGRLIKKIGTTGRGPGEYSRFTKFTVDDRTGTVYIQDSENRIQVYSEDGNFIKSISILEFGGNIDLVSIYNSRLLIFNYLSFGDAKYNWIILDTLANSIKVKNRANPVFWSNWSGRSGTYYINNNLNYWNTYNDTVYSITPDLNWRASFVFKEGEHRLPRQKIDTDKLSQYLLIQSVFETKKYFIIRFFFNNNKLLTLVEKEGYKSYTIPIESNISGGIVNDLDGGAAFLPEFYFLANSSEYIVGYIDAYQLKKYVSSAVFQKSKAQFIEKKDKLEKLSNSLKITDNPIMILVKLKE